jgi:hypothetical protein
MCPMTGHNGEILWTQQWLFHLHERRKLFWLPERLFASHAELCSITLGKSAYWYLQLLVVLGVRQMQINTAVFRDIMPCSLLDKYRRFGDTCFLNIPCCSSTFVRKLIGILGTTRRHTPGDKSWILTTGRNWKFTLIWIDFKMILFHN